MENWRIDVKFLRAALLSFVVSYHLRSGALRVCTNLSYAPLALLASSVAGDDKQVRRWRSHAKSMAATRASFSPGSVGNRAVMLIG